MEYLVTAKQMRLYDNNTSEHFKVPSAVLMERAALACLQVLLKRQSQIECGLAQTGARAKRRVLAVCGNGNNGGDGFALGRLLMQENFQVDFCLVGNPDKATELTKNQMESVRAYGGTILRTLPETEYDIIIDALFGVGLSRELAGEYKNAVEFINGRDAFVLSVDIPSGIHADTGAVMGAAVCADVTVTFGFRKLGTFLYPGARYAGRVLCFPIGITQDSFLGNVPETFTFTEPVSMLMPCRAQEGNKGSFGRISILAGSEKMAGAAILAGRGALAAGCGMLKLVGPSCNREIIQETLPEAMQTDDIAEAADWADVIAAGPGLSCADRAKRQLRYIIEKTDSPLILDADAINILAQDRALLERLEDRQKNEKTRRKLALTPHPGELARLCTCTVKEVLSDPAGYAGMWARRLGAVVLCKGARTFAASPDGQLYVNGSGNSGMATAGSGDVLTGIMAGLLGQEQDLFPAVCVAVYLHGLAGDRAAHVKTEYSMKAGDIIEMVPQVLQTEMRNEYETL